MLKTSLVLTLGMSFAPAALLAGVLDGDSYKGSYKNSIYGSKYDEGYGYGKGKNGKPNFPKNGSLLGNAKVAKKYCQQNPNSIRCDKDGDYKGTQADKLEYIEKIAAKNGNPIKSSPVNKGQPAQLVEVDGNLYPICSSQAVDPDGDNWGWENDRTCVFTYSYCNSAASDADGDGWGWENNKSCVVR